MSKIDIKSMSFDKTSIDSINGYYTDYPVVYFLNNDTTVYIGETVAVRNRMRDHLNNRERKSLKKMSLIIHEKFN
ncbi:GIY-YIG nuclease family protein [Peribacillus huizhouensis]|uniref:GIY-YIG superfamily endonuclease n=1 Tax=Peribacillus huizhouensis TaxID=1501239 RepID=A0ABR6CQ58_9BACI|nr:GIY-YIG nuclease family protein [Peribacillus huizhouensis]MBA9026487.1 putative GIY-YIG superfamily endonuclease [Peribacillus huizhouensis]